jgi:hypothetical protein
MRSHTSRADIPSRLPWPWLRRIALRSERLDQLIRTHVNTKFLELVGDDIL